MRTPTHPMQDHRHPELHHSRRRSWCWAPAVAAFVAASFTLAPSVARAQDADNAVDPTGKGIAGGALLGGEVVMIITAAVGAKSWWPYVLFGAVGAGGGAVGGYFVEQASPPAEPSLYMLAGGMALVVPTLVAVLNATAYDPVDDEDVEEEPADGDPAGPDVDGGVSLGAEARAPLPMGLIAIQADDTPSVHLGVPAVVVHPAFSPIEVAKYGVEQETEIHIPIVAGSF